MTNLFNVLLYVTIIIYVSEPCRAVSIFKGDKIRPLCKVRSLSCISMSSPLISSSSTTQATPQYPSPSAQKSMFGVGRGDTRTPTEENRPLMNEEIKAPRVRCLIAKPEGDEQLGIIDTSEALARAAELGVDLIIIAGNADPPVCKIIDFGKHKYMAEKKKKDSKKNTKQTEMKEVKMSYKIEEHDYQVRLKSAQKFISQGNRVKIVIQFRGREQQHMDLGHELIQKLVDDCHGTVVTDGRPKREGNRLSIIIAPKST